MLLKTSAYVVHLPTGTKSWDLVPGKVLFSPIKALTAIIGLPFLMFFVAKKIKNKGRKWLATLSFPLVYICALTMFILFVLVAYVWLLIPLSTIVFLGLLSLVVDFDAASYLFATMITILIGFEVTSAYLYLWEYSQLGTIVFALFWIPFIYTTVMVVLVDAFYFFCLVVLGKQKAEIVELLEVEFHFLRGNAHYNE